MPKLFVVATPIGNLNDLTPRMREAIERADLIAAEDTRVTMKLLNHWDVKKPLISCHRHNEEDKAPEIVERMSKVGNRASALFVSLMGHFCRTQKEVFGWEGGPLHDPVTIASLIDPELVTTKPMNAQIELRSEQSYGRTNCDYFNYRKLPPTADVAVDIDPARFWDIFEEGLRNYV